MRYVDLRRARCPGRSRFKPLKRTARVALTRASYTDPYSVVVVRGCDLKTGRDRVLTQAVSRFESSHSLRVVGIDGTSVRFERHEASEGTFCTRTVSFSVDVVSGRRGRQAESTICPQRLQSGL